MIAKGNLHAHGRKLADYLTKTDKAGERVELVELRGFASDNIHDAFTDVQIQAEATRSTKPFFHAYIRLPDSDELGRDQWQLVADRIERQLGFEGQPRAVAFHHQDDGTTHMHMAWSRIDLEKMQTIDPGLYKNKLKEVSRELEAELGLTQVRNERDPQDKTRSAGRNEFEQARRLDTNLKEIRETIRDCWDRSDNGRAFAAAIDEKQLILARGDRRDFVVVDREGGDHALSKRITGATAAQTRERLADIDRSALPTVDQAKEMQRERAHSAQLAAASIEKAKADAATRARTDAAEMPRATQQAPVAPEPYKGFRGFGRTAESGFRVGGKAAGVAGERLTDFVSGLLDFVSGSSPTHEITPAEYARDPAARRAYHEQQAAERAAQEARSAALGQIRDDIGQGRSFEPAAIRSLSRDDLLNIKANGDDGLRRIVEDHEREQQRQRDDLGRERER